MSAAPKDPLLTVARVLLVAFIAVIAFAATAVALALPMLLWFQDEVLAAMAKEGVVVGSEMVGAIALVMVGVVALLALAIYFLVLLRRIVFSVRDGDPFTPANADRLSRMGWVAVIGELATIPFAGLVLWIAGIVEDSPGAKTAGIDSDFDFSPTGLLLILVLFILARVFREGTRLRDEVEGTV